MSSPLALNGTLEFDATPDRLHQVKCPACGQYREVRKETPPRLCRKCSSAKVGLAKKHIGPWEVECCQCGVKEQRKTKKRPDLARRKTFLCKSCRAKKRGAIAHLKKTGFGMVCSVDGCGDGSFRNGLCLVHSTQQSLSYRLQNISREDILDHRVSYLAGLIDGEGTICIFKTKNRPTKSGGKVGATDRYRAIVSISNTSIEVMNWLDENFGERSLPVSRNRDNDSRFKKCYAWTITHAAAALLLKRVIPFLVIKKKQAGLFLEFMETSQRTGRGGKPEAVIAKREMIYSEISRLNRRCDYAVEIK
jgi:hypothetical protein